MQRIIPVFLLKGKRLVKGTCFRDFVDVGDPVSQAMIYDAQGADEIVIVDIEASKTGRLIDTGIVKDMIYKCRLPIGVGGGIKTVEDARKCFAQGADKIIVNTHAVENPGLIREMANEFGSQSVLVSIDVRKEGNGYAIYTHSGTKKASIGFEEYLKKAVESGAGEILVTSIDREGTLKGLDIELCRKARKIVPVPLITSGGAGSYDDIVDALGTGCDACGIGKMLFLRDYDIVRIKSYLKGKKVQVRDS